MRLQTVLTLLPVNIEHAPHADIATFGLVHLFKGVEGKEAAADDKEGVNSKESVPDGSEG